MTHAYPAFIRQDGSKFLVYIPDVDHWTEGHDFADAIARARDLLGCCGMDWSTDKDAPIPSSPAEALKKARAREEAPDDFKFSEGVLTYVDIDFDAYRKRVKNSSVKKNCTLPYSLNEWAEERGINFSRVLQDALQEMRDKED